MHSWGVEDRVPEEILASGGRAHLAALTGRGTSPGIFDVLAVLGREESLGRIADQAG